MGPTMTCNRKRRSRLSSSETDHMMLLNSRRHGNTGDLGREVATITVGGIYGSVPKRGQDRPAVFCYHFLGLGDCETQQQAEA